MSSVAKPLPHHLVGINLQLLALQMLRINNHNDRLWWTAELESKPLPHGAT
jgi:hypothetical protein